MLRSGFRFSPVLSPVPVQIPLPVPDLAQLIVSVVSAVQVGRGPRPGQYPDLRPVPSLGRDPGPLGPGHRSCRQSRPRRGTAGHLSEAAVSRRLAVTSPINRCRRRATTPAAHGELLAPDVETTSLLSRETHAEVRLDVHGVKLPTRLFGLNPHTQLLHGKCQTPSKRRMDERTDKRRESNSVHFTLKM